MIISLVQTKGGTGKSTLSQCLAFSKTLGKEFPKVALVELDEQGTLRRWWRTRLARELPAKGAAFFHISSVEEAEIIRAMEPIMASHDLLVMDIPGESVSKFHTNFACAISDLVLIPMRTSTNDEDAFEANLLPIIDQILDRHPEKRGTFFVVPAFTHPLAGKAKIVSYFTEILPNSIQCLNAVFPFRTVYENCNREGLNLYEFTKLVRRNKRDYKQAKNAENDIRFISKEIFNKLWGAVRDGVSENQAKEQDGRLAQVAR